MKKTQNSKKIFQKLRFLFFTIQIRRLMESVWSDQMLVGKFWTVVIFLDARNDEIPKLETKK